MVDPVCNVRGPVNSPQSAAAGTEKVVPLNRRTGFARVPKRAKDVGLSGKEHDVLVAACIYLDANGKVLAGKPRLLRESHVHSRHFGRYLGAVIDAGLMREDDDGTLWVLFDDEDRPNPGPSDEPNPGPDEPNPGPDEPNLGPNRPNLGLDIYIEENTPLKNLPQTLSQSAGACVCVCVCDGLVIDQDGNRVEATEVKDAFERFWFASPHRPDDPKTKARDEFNKLITNGVDPEHLIGAAERRATTVPDDPRYIKHTWRWLTEGEFRDQEEAHPDGWLGRTARAVWNLTRRRQEEPAERHTREHMPDWKWLAERFLDTGDWQEDLGPKPGQPGCKMPEGRLRDTLIKLKRRAESGAS
jgi:hypothetical protein